MTALEDALGAIDGIADAFVAGKHIPGIAYGVVAGGDLIHSRGIGTLRVGESVIPDADSVFRIASMTKSFTAATVLNLRDEGLVALDEPIAHYVPEVSGLRGPTADSPVITVRHLLSMSSGLATDDPWGDRQQGLDLATFADLLRGPLTFAWTPGTRFEYSNLGYGILGRLITNVAGAEYRDVVRDRIIRPLGMDSTTYEEGEVPVDRLAHGYLWRDEDFVEEPLDPYGALASMGGIFTSIRDLSRWVRFFADAFPPRDDAEGTQPLSRASRREMQQAASASWPIVQMRAPDAEPEISAISYGFGLFVEENARFGRIVSHSGGYPGFGSNMRWQPASGLGVIVLANHRYAPTTGLAREIMTSLLESAVVPARPLRPSGALSAARSGIERLLVAWDDELAARLFAMNIDLDEPLTRRREQIAKVHEVHGALVPDPDLPERSGTPLDVSWWLADQRGGRVRVDLGLSPESPSRVQTFELTSVPAPEEALTAKASSIVVAINGPRPSLPGELVLSPEIDRSSLDRIVRIVGARHAPLSLGPAVAGDGTKSATWRLRGDHGELDLAMTVDPETDLVLTLTVMHRPLLLPQHGA